MSKEFKCDRDGCDNMIADGDGRYIGSTRVCPDCEVREITMVDVFAEALMNSVRAEIESDIGRYGRCRCWTDLHDVCDANEFLIEVCEKIGEPFTNSDWVGSDAARAVEGYAVKFVNQHVFTPDYALRANLEIVRGYIADTFPNSHEWAGCSHIEFGDIRLMVDVEYDKMIRVGVYKIDDSGTVVENPHIWMEFGADADADQIIGIIDALTDLP